MADTSILTAAQIAAQADAGAVRVVTTTDSVVRAFRGDRFTFYVSDASAPGGSAPWVRIENGSFAFEGPVASLAGPTAADAITNAEGLALIALLKKIHVAKVHP